MHRVQLVPVLLAIALTRVNAQSLAARVGGLDGVVQVIYPSRAAACGDGDGMMGGVIGSGRSTYYSGNATYSGRGSWTNRPCLHGPARVLATVVSGEVTRLRAYVGPVPEPRPDTRSINPTAQDAAGWLADIIARSTYRSASEAMLPLVVAEGSNPCPLLLRVARDESRPRNVRRSAIGDRLVVAGSERASWTRRRRGFVG